MAASSWVKVSGGWHQITQIWVRVSGVWRSVQRAYSKVAGVWELTFVHLTPFTQDFTTPGSFSPTIPIGASSLTIGVTGGGGGSNGASGICGAAGGTAQRTVAIIPADWGQPVSIVVAQGGTTGPTNGGGSTCSLTIAAGSFALAGNGGGTSNSSAGGTATGGTINTTGHWLANNSPLTPNRGGDSVWAQGGLFNSSPGTQNGSLGSGAGVTSGNLPGVGGDGRVKLDWS